MLETCASQKFWCGSGPNITFVVSRVAITLIVLSTSKYFESQLLYMVAMPLVEHEGITSSEGVNFRFCSANTEGTKSLHIIKPAKPRFSLTVKLNLLKQSRNSTVIDSQHSVILTVS